MLEVDDIIDDVRKILEDAATGKGPDRHYMTAYQILERHPQRDLLIQQWGGAGAGAGVPFGAASLISKAARRVAGVEVEHMDAGGSRFTVAGQDIVPGYEVIGLYRLR